METFPKFSVRLPQQGPHNTLTQYCRPSACLAWIMFSWKLPRSEQHQLPNHMTRASHQSNELRAKAHVWKSQLAVQRGAEETHSHFNVMPFHVFYLNNDPFDLCSSHFGDCWIFLLSFKLFNQDVSSVDLRSFIFELLLKNSSSLLCLQLSVFTLFTQICMSSCG